MASDMLVRVVDDCNNATVHTALKADMDTVSVDPDKFKFAFPIQLGGGKVIVVWGYDSG